MKELTYGIIQEFENGTTLWYEPITDELDGFVLRRSGGDIQSVYSKDRESYILDSNDANVITVFEPKEKDGK